MSKGKWFVVVFLFGFYNYFFAQDTISKGKTKLITHIVNVIPDQNNRFLDGLINIAYGSHSSTHISLFNWNQKNFKGLQLAIVNVAGGNVKGAQISFFNNCFDTLNGFQLGLINITKVNNALQIGIINYSDTISSGSMWSFITIVRHGGYYAVEYYISEMFPVNMSVKLGLFKRHNALHLSTDGNNNLFFGGGLGGIRKISERFFFNPEFSYQSAIKNNQALMSICPKFLFALHSRIALSAGLSFVWNHSKTRQLNNPYFALIDENSANGKNKFVLGLRFGIRYNITKI
jgi:hypothetical protein